MQTCKHCKGLTVPTQPFCDACEHDRIAEALLAPRRRPPWFRLTFRTLALASALFFAFTVAVAFLREAQALRWSRADIEEGDPHDAVKRLRPYLDEHPNSAEGLMLAGKASIRTGLATETVARLTQLRDLPGRGAARRSKRLQHDVAQQIVAFAPQLGCGQLTFATFVEPFDPVTPSFEPSLMEAATIVTKRCVVHDDARVANEPGYWLIHERGEDAEAVVTKLFLEQLAPTLARHDYVRARRLSEHGAELWPAGLPLFSEALEPARKALAESMATLRGGIGQIENDPAHRKGRSYCFPASAPAYISDLRDAWGHALIYTPGSPTRDNTCYQTFTLATPGADGTPSPDDYAGPSMDRRCEFDRWGRVRCSDPDRFWHLPSA